MTAVTILGIETSCDDTAAAIIRIGADHRPRVLSSIVRAQHKEHAPFGGVVPEIAARSHVELIDSVIEAALSAAGASLDDLTAVAATAGPGLVGGVMVGFTTAKAIALGGGLPLIPVNHLEGHALSVRLTEDVEYPYLLLLVSGGHTQLIEVAGLGEYRRLGTTIDDAAGEAFDKTAKLLGLGAPGGPKIEAAATGGRDDRFVYPEPLKRAPGCDFSFSGMKTAVRETAVALTTPTGQDIADIAASFQAAAARHLADRTARAMAMTAQQTNRLVVAGGVAANCTVKAMLATLCEREGWSLSFPPAKYCTDNAAMIALAGGERLLAGLAPDLDASLSMAPRARWPLAPPPTGAEIGGGRKGPKA